MLIAARELKFKESGRIVIIPIRLFAPKDEGLSWASRIEIGWPDGQFELDVHGHDAFQSLELALKTIGAVVYSSDYHKSGNLLWLEQSDGYGFPVPVTLRDLLIGSDKNFL